MVLHPVTGRLSHIRQGEAECAAAAPSHRLNPESATHHLDDTFDDCEADACSRDFRVELVEQPEYSVVETGIDPDSVVLDEEHVFRSLVPEANLDFRLRLLSHEFDSVADQVFEDLTQSRTIAVNRWKVVIDDELDTALEETPDDDLGGLLDHLGQQNILRRIDHATDSRKLEQLIERRPHLGHRSRDPRGVLVDASEIALGGGLFDEAHESLIVISGLFRSCDTV